MVSNRRCVILVPVAHYIEPHCALALGQLEASGYPVKRLYGISSVDVARNRLATEALLEGFDELMWIDADMAFDPTSVERLRAHGLPICCGIYPKKVEKALTTQFLPGTEQITLGKGGGLLEVMHAAAGFLYTKREVYLEVQRREELPTCNTSSVHPFLPFFLPMVLRQGDDFRYLSDDFAFSERLRRCGYRIMADTTIRLQHIGIYGYGWEDVAEGVARAESYTLKFSRR